MLDRQPGERVVVAGIWHPTKCQLSWGHWVSLFYSVFRTPITMTSLDFYSNLTRLLGKEVLHSLEERGNPNSERPGNLPKLKFLLNQINQAKPGFKTRSPTPSPVLPIALNPLSHTPFLSFFFSSNKCQVSVLFQAFPLLSLDVCISFLFICLDRDEGQWVGGWGGVPVCVRPGPACPRRPACPRLRMACCHSYQG